MSGPDRLGSRKVNGMGDAHAELMSRFQRIFACDGLAGEGNRLAILRAFLDCEVHVGAEDLFHRLQAADRPGDDTMPISLDEVESTLEMFVNYGLAVKREFEGQPTRYEHVHPGRDHDHMICVRCGRIVEIADARLEALLEQLARREGLRPLAHRLEIYGLCRRCDARPGPLMPLSSLPEGTRARIITLTGGRGLQARLISMGLNPGSEVAVVNNTGPGPFIIASRGTRIALGFGLARRLLVMPLNAERR